MRPAPDIATCMYYTGLGPFTGQEVHVWRHLKDRKLQRALFRSFKPETDFEVRQALMASGRSDLIGSGCDCLIPSNPPNAALKPRMDEAGRELTEGRYVHTIKSDETARSGETARGTRAQSTPAPGYRPHRNSTRKKKQRPR